MSHELSLSSTAEARTPTTHYSPLTIYAAALLWLLALAPTWAAEWTIVKGGAATEMDSLAASELRKYVGLMTGNPPPIITDTQTPATASVFLMGKAETHRVIRDLAGRGLVRLSATEPGPQGFINKTVDADGRHYVVLAGGDDLGLQYAVYDFLESYCKVGFLLDGENVPRVESLEVKALDVSKKPYCQFRQQSVYGKCKLWYGAGTWPSLSTFEKDGYKTGWQDFIDWMVKKKQNVLYLKRGFFSVGYALGFPEMNNPRDLESIELEGAWFRTPFTADLVAQLIAYARSRGMKTCYTATICRMPVAFKRHIQDPRHPCYDLKYEEKGNWIRLDPLDDRSYSYCLRRHAEAIVKKFGKPDFWYGYYGWSEQPPSMGLKARSHCHYKAHDLAFRHTGGALLVYTWDWGWHNMPFAEEWDHFKRVMPRDGSVVVAVNTGPGPFLKDPAGPFAGFPWWQYLTSTADDQCLPEQFRTLKQSYADWRALLTTCGRNPPQGFGLDNMIHHVDQRLTDFECGQAFTPTAHQTTLDAYLADYVARAYGSGPHTDDLLRLHKLWADQRKVTHAQVEQSMTPHWLRLKSNLIYRTDLTEALYYEASAQDKCALTFGKWIYSLKFTEDWAAANIPASAWVPGGQRLWQSIARFPSDMTYENKAKFLGEIQSGTLAVRVVDAQNRPLAGKHVRLQRGHLTRIEFQDSFELMTDAQGEAKVSLRPDIYEITVPGTDRGVPALMLHKRDKAANLALP